MVLGLKTKKKGIPVQVDYIVTVLEVKPWPPSVNLCSIQTVMIQWENGEQNSGFLPPGVPSLNGFEAGKIEFNEFFKLPVTLVTSGKNKAGRGFQKNYLEFSLYEPRKEKAAKGQLLGTATINLAEYGIIKDTETITAPIAIKKMAKGVVQPDLYITIQPFDNEGIESVLRLMSEQCEDDSDLTSVTDDDEGSSHSSRTPSAASVGSSPLDEMLNYVTGGMNPDLASPRSLQVNGDIDRRSSKQITTRQKELPENQQDEVSGKQNFTSEEDDFSKFTEVTPRKQARSHTLKFGRRGLDLQNIMFPDKLKHMKSVRLPSETAGIGTELLSTLHPQQQQQQQSSTLHLDKAKDNSSTYTDPKPKAPDTISKEIKNANAENKDELESRIQSLEEELREAAALEVGLYSIVTEHVSSKRKVHTPARRLSRYYLHAHRAGSLTKRASAAKTTVSGLVLVSKACGNDVSRLTFWLSNSVMLRGIITQINKEVPSPVEPSVETKGRGKKSERSSTPNYPKDDQDDWEDPLTFAIALEKIEAWIFSRIVESLWWQSFTPHMQPKAVKKRGRRTGSRSIHRLSFSLGDQEQGNFSTDLWKKAFRDACERLCPIRAGGHDCGCLPMLPRMVMEHLADRLDVAMFNAILRDTYEEMPTDPISDPITDPRVLPIPAGKSSFGSGAQLKNAVASWSKCLADFFSSDRDDEHRSDQQKKLEPEAFSREFRLLNALSDLMMLPLGMLRDASTRKEVCPLLGAPVIKRVLNNFVPDEFSPNPVPDSVIRAIDIEGPRDNSEKSINTFPCTVNPLVYYSTPAASLSNMIGDIGDQSHQKGGASILKKSYNSDDELDKLNLPLSSITTENIRISPAFTKPNWAPKGKGGRSVVRYTLLHDVWKNGA